MLEWSVVALVESASFAYSSFGNCPTALLTSLSAWQRAGGIDEALVAVQLRACRTGKGDDDVLRVRLEVPRPCKQRCVLDDVRRSQHCLDELEAITGKLE